MNNIIAKEFNYGSLIKFAIPSMIAMVFTALYTIVDGVFVSQYVGTNALSAMNIVWPFINIIIGVGIMLGTGGSAVIAKKMGEGKEKEANKAFTTIILFGLMISLLLALVSICFTEQMVMLLGANTNIKQYGMDYLRILMIFSPAFMLQVLFQMFFVTAGRPKLGLILTVLAGVVNGILDYIFIALLDMGIKGAAYATVSGYMIPAIAGVVFFVKNYGLHFEKTSWNGRVLIKTCLNGSSEMVSNLAVSIVTFLFNFYMMKYHGEKGVAAITIVLYTQFLFSSMFFGFSNGVAPIFSYNYGSKNKKHLQRVFKICVKFIMAASVVMFVIAVSLAEPIVRIFASQDLRTYEITLHGSRLFSVCYLFTGMNIWTSSLFTSLSNGKVSAILSFMRTFVFIVIGFTVLPVLLEVDGIWLSMPFAEILTFLLSLWLVIKNKSKYGYYGA